MGEGIVVVRREEGGERELDEWRVDGWIGKGLLRN
jgi:hypothetical protein